MNEEALGPTIIPGERPPKTDGTPQVKATTGLTEGKPSISLLGERPSLITRVARRVLSVFAEK